MKMSLTLCLHTVSIQNFQEYNFLSLSLTLYDRMSVCMDKIEMQNKNHTSRTSPSNNVWKNLFHKQIFILFRKTFAICIAIRKSFFFLTRSIQIKMDDHDDRI